MANVNIKFNGKEFLLSCEDGQEEHLQELSLNLNEKFDDLLFLEGSGDHPGFFDIAFLPVIGTQKMFNYQHNGRDRIQFDLCTS